MTGAERPRFDPTHLSVILGAALLLSLFTVWYQMKFMGLDWYETVQWERTLRVMHGESGTPWQYRLFTESIVYGLVRAFEALGVPRAAGVAFILVRLAQNTLAFTLAVCFCRRLGLTTAEGVFGIGLLGWGMCHSLYDGDLTFNTYTDMSIFLTAGLLILARRDWWLVPLMVVAPFNRETSGCIPFMLLFARWQWGAWPPISRKTLLQFAACLLLWAAVIGGLRLVFGVRPYIVPTAGEKPVLPLLTYNLTWWRTWVFLFATLGLLPLFALASWKAWPVPLRRFFWAVVPVWFPVHFSLAHAPETRLFLVPQVLVFVPGALLGIGYWARPTSTGRTRSASGTPPESGRTG